MTKRKRSQRLWYSSGSLSESASSGRASGGKEMTAWATTSFGHWPRHPLHSPRRPFFGNAAAQQGDRRSAQRCAARSRRSAHRDDGEHVAQVEPHVAGEAVDLRGDVQVLRRQLVLALGEVPRAYRGPVRTPQRVSTARSGVNVRQQEEGSGGRLVFSAARPRRGTFRRRLRRRLRRVRFRLHVRLHCPRRTSGPRLRNTLVVAIGGCVARLVLRPCVGAVLEESGRGAARLRVGGRQVQRRRAAVRLGG